MINCKENNLFQSLLILKEKWERRYINENDIKILEKDVMELQNKFNVRLIFNCNYSKHISNEIFIYISL